MVETPFIIVTIGDYTFGVANKQKMSYGNYKVDFPNYIDSMTVTKINGTVNQYELSMTYQITQNDDPNMFEKIFSSVSKTRKIVFSYGDWSYPSYIYKDEEGIITKINTQFNAQQSRISYRISAVSTCALLTAVRANFPARIAKASDVLKELINNDQYKIQELFPGMTNANINKYNLIPGDDTVVDIHRQVGMSVIDYIKYLVNCMKFQGDTSADGARNYIYVITMDANKQTMNGEYFKITKIGVNSGYQYINNQAEYVINVGYPDKKGVMDFSVEQGDNWSILYNYNKQIAVPKHTYSIDNDGNLEATETNNLTMDYTLSKEDSAQQNWWSQVTAFPIKATLKIKGLMRPQLLMSYIKVNVLFYGRKHIASGIYSILKQTDDIDANGYRTTLQLLRIKGDDEQ